jgi:tripartite ATP-independent transporter DctM subunit
MSREIIGILGMISFLLLMFFRIPLGYVFALVGAIGTVTLLNFDGGMSLFAMIPYEWATQYSFSCLPMFVLMGLLLSETGIAGDLYLASYKWVGRLPGGLAMATLFATAFFSALSGSAVAAAAAISSICYPEMKKYNYAPVLSTGVIASGATMDLMIPPSIPMIIYGMAANVSVGKMFIAGFIPGVIEVLLFCLFIYILVRRNPSLARLSEERPSLKEKIKGLKGVAPVVLIFLFTFGGMYLGVFTPTEAGAAAVLSSLLLCWFLGRLNWKRLRSSLGQTVTLTGQIFVIIFGCMIFNKFIALSGLSGILAGWTVQIGISQNLFLVIVLFGYLILGALMEEISMMLLTIPIYMPTVQTLGIDPIWFGILVILAWQIGNIAPPVGLICFVTQSAIKEVSIQTVYRGCLPFILALVIVEAIVILVPDTALFLVKFMVK